MTLAEARFTLMTVTKNDLIFIKNEEKKKYKPSSINAEEVSVGDL